MGDNNGRNGLRDGEIQGHQDWDLKFLHHIGGNTQQRMMINKSFYRFQNRGFGKGALQEEVVYVLGTAITKGVA